MAIGEVYAFIVHLQITIFVVSSREVKPMEQPMDATIIIATILIGIFVTNIGVYQMAVPPQDRPHLNQGIAMLAFVILVGGIAYLLSRQFDHLVISGLIHEATHGDKMAHFTIGMLFVLLYDLFAITLLGIRNIYRWH